MAEKMLQVQVCYAKPNLQFLQELKVVSGTTLRSAIDQSGVLQNMPEIDLTICQVGIYGKLKQFDTLLRDRDRIEIYRALIADPKESRRKRAEKISDKKA